MMLVRSAVEHGAAATTYTRVLDYLRDGEEVIAATVRDETTGEELDVHARTTILAGGVWTGRQQDLVTSEQGLRVQASKGVHRSEEHTSELQSRGHLVCRLLLAKKK